MVLDVGCNIGAFALWIYPHASHIYAVDCVDEHIANLRKTVTDSGLKKIKAFTIKMAQEDGAGRDGVPEFSVNGFMSGNAIEKVDILKLDVEGDELGIINAADFPVDRINTIVGEHHYDGEKLSQFRDRLTELGFKYSEYPNSHFLARK